VKRLRKKFVGKVKLIPPTHESARDEGPRLIPLSKILGNPETTDYYVGLADLLLKFERADSSS
jgi:hypothetical protein